MTDPLLTGPRVELCVVGDDDQAIYQWRGSDVRNIVEFTDRYPGVRTFTITVNRRSRPHIVAAASFASSIPGRLDKEMSAYEDFDGEPDLLVDAVDPTTKAKGLEWDAVFLPSLTTSRFPPSRTGRPRDRRSSGLSAR